MKYEPENSILLLTQETIWESAIRRVMSNANITWTLNLDDVMAEASRRYGSVALVEIKAGRIKETCGQIAAWANNPYELIFIAVGSYQLGNWSPLLKSAGFVDFFHSTTQVERVVTIAKRHFDNVVMPTVTLEEKFAARLPWKPQASNNLNPNNKKQSENHEQ